MAPSSGQELVKAINTSLSINNCPSAFRFPRGDAKEKINFDDDEILEIGKAKIVQQGERVVVIAYGTILENAIQASKILKEEDNLNLTIVDARFAKPFDEELFIKLAQENEILITIEEGAIGGFGSAVNQFLNDKGLLDGKCKFRSLFMADKFIEHGDVSKMQEEAGIGVGNIVELVRNFK